MKSTNEMHILNKYKYIGNTINKAVSSTVTGNMSNKVKGPKGKEMDEKTLAKLAKKEEMKKLCQPKTTQVYIEKKKYVNTTPIGEKKDLSGPMPDAYDPSYVEAAWDAWWERKQFFRVSVEKAMEVPRNKRFVMLLPPPNVTGYLHLGHTLMGAIEDSITRWKRMKGYCALWVPGTDHAGIATQSVVERKLLKTEGKYRSEYTRKEFLDKVWEWKQEYGNRIMLQFTRLGVSFDLNRTYFTMDDPRSAAVKEAFIRLYESGKLYRAERIVHWCCALKTAISDVEIEDLELDGPTMMSVPLHKGKYEFGVLIDFAYKLKDDPSREIVVSTTRIETMLGDVAVAVHPDDERYKDLIGKELIHPFFKDRHMKVIADPILVDKSFGTGAVKITPGHDPNDFLCGQRHHLPIITIFNDDGILNENGGPFQGMRRYDCRNAILEKLKELNLYRDKRPNKMVIQVCSKTEDIIEPLVKAQWWINCKEVAARTINDVKAGRLRIIPDFQEKTLFGFLENIRDWCVSRQLWWGHQCPIYLVKIPGILDNPSTCNNDHWVAAKSEEEAIKKASIKFNCADTSIITVTQDEDVLDTWFSSALLPFSTFGWPDTSSEELKTFFPTDLLETGHDIIFFWVARMIFMSYFFLDTLPFHTVFLHPIVRDAQGRKMSKTLGNVIDPLEVIDGISLEEIIKKLKDGNLPASYIEKSVKERQKEFPEGIPECGADALRLGLMSYLVQGRNINLDINRVVNYRFFGNKLWNATKFALRYFDKDFKHQPIDRTRLSFIDRWILSKLATASRTFDDSFERYNFGEATDSVYAFWQYSLCDVYIEAIKPVLADSSPFDNESKNNTRNVLYQCMESGFKLLHPLMPFITEELYQRLPSSEKKAESICIAEFPMDYTFIDPEIEKHGEILLDIVHSILSVLSQFQINKKLKPRVCVYSDAPWLLELVQKEQLLISTLSRTSTVHVISDKKDPLVKGWLINVINANTDVYLDIRDQIDIKKELKRLEGSLTEKKKFAVDLESKISKKEYATKVPESVQVAEKEKYNKILIEIEKIKASIDNLQSLNN